MADYPILSEHLEDQLKAVEWARAEQERILKENSEPLTKELAEKMRPVILERRKACAR